MNLTELPLWTQYFIWVGSGLGMVSFVSGIVAFVSMLWHKKEITIKLFNFSIGFTTASIVIVLILIIITAIILLG